MSSIVHGTAVVVLDRDVEDVPTSALDETGRALLDDFLVVDAKRAEKNDEREVAKNAPSEEARRSREAGSKGTKPVPSFGEAYWAARVDSLGVEVLALAREAKAKADLYEAHVRKSPAIAEGLARDITATQAELTSLAERSAFLSGRLRSLGETARTLTAARAFAEGRTPDEGAARRQAVFDAFRAAHQSDKAYQEPGTLASAWTTILSAARDFPVAAYAARDLDYVIAQGHEAQRQAAFAPRAIETDAQRIARLLAQSGASTPPRPAVRSFGQIPPEEVKATASARRAENPHRT